MGDRKTAGLFSSVEMTGLGLYGRKRSTFAHYPTRFRSAKDGPRGFGGWVETDVSDARHQAHGCVGVRYAGRRVWKGVYADFVGFKDCGGLFGGGNACSTGG